MNKELEALKKKLKQLFKEYERAVKYSSIDIVVADRTLFPIIEAALKRNVKLEEENKILTTIKNNFNVYNFYDYSQSKNGMSRVVLQFRQCCTMKQIEYEKLIEYFGEPGDE